MEAGKMLLRFSRCLRHTNNYRFCSNSDQQPQEPSIPVYQPKDNESISVKKARLMYQSRKRGMLENDLILSTFANKYLMTMDEDQLCQYDRLINLPFNDWDIYYWATGVKEVPNEFNNEIMAMLKQHIRDNKEQRSRQPELNYVKS